MRTLSLGWGVQSFTLAAMVANGELPPLDFAISGDTKHESKLTYRFIDRWQPWLEARNVKVVTVQAKNTDVVKPSPSTDHVYTIIPAFTANDEDRGQLRRQCTSRWKIEPIYKFLRAELKRRQIELSLDVVEQWLGISLDEQQRAKENAEFWIKNVHPLIDLRMTRNDCEQKLRRYGLEVPPKSACNICPYRNGLAWQRMKQENGQDWQDALQVDQYLRSSGRNWYLHSERIPLEQAVRIAEDHGLSQQSIFDDELTCDSGHCFV